MNNSLQNEFNKLESDLKLTNPTEVPLMSDDFLMKH